MIRKIKKIISCLILFFISIIKYSPHGISMLARNLLYSFVLKSMGSRCNICDGITILEPYLLSLGKRVSIHEYTLIGGGGEVKIGDYVAIGSHCSIISGTHNFSRRDIPIKEQGTTPDHIIIGNNVWIGTHVAILGGVKIGDGAVIGAGSVVTKDIPENSIAVGVPCRVKSYR